ncbi:MAG: hypothetical protein ACP5FT_01275 [Acidilobus sp.]
MKPTGTGALTMRLCSRCNRRPAVFFRSASGEALCRSCLWDEVSASSSKAFKDVELRPTSRFLVPLSSFAPSASLLAALVLAHVERRFPSTVLLAMPSFYDVTLPRDLPFNLKAIRFTVSPAPPTRASLISCLRYDRAWALRAASLVGADVVVLPLSRTDLTGVLLEGLLTGTPEASFDAQPSAEVGRVKVVGLFSNLERESVAALEYLEGVSLRPACDIEWKTKPVMMSIAGAPERDYGALEVAPRIVRLVSRPSSCSACGAPAEGPLCSYCLRLGLDRLSVSLASPPGQGLEPP